MKSIALFVLLCIFFPAFTQNTEENILYVIDSVPVLEDPSEDDGELSETDIETLTVVTNKEDIEKYGRKNIDKIIFITTKEYLKRSDSLKKIPSVKQMERREGKWYLIGSSTPYTGSFTDYYLNGKKQGDGFFNEGLVEGLRTVYYQDGTKSYYRYYQNGIENGESQEFHPNGKIHQEGVFKNGKENGIWKEWYSTGHLKRQVEFKDGASISTKEEDKFYKLLSNGVKLSKEGNFPAAVKVFDKAIELNPNFSDALFYRGTAYLNDFKFDEAINDFDRAIQLEPYYMESLSNRAFARLRKYEFKNSRTLSKNKYTTVLASKDKVEIPNEELDKICADLNSGFNLGDKKAMIVDAMKKYCQN